MKICNRLLTDTTLKPSEHFQSLDNFIGDTARLKKLIDYGSLDAAIGTFKQYYAAYLKGDVMQASKIRNGVTV